MKIFFSILFLFFLSGKVLVAQVESSHPTDAIVALPVFYYDIFNFAGTDSANTRVDVFVKVPFNVLQFVKSSNQFLAEYSVIITVRNENKSRIIQEKIFNEKITTPDFNKTNSSSNFKISLRSFRLPAANYVIKIELEDKDSRKTYSFENKFLVRNFGKQFSVSDIILLEDLPSEKTDNKIFPNISNFLTIEKLAIPFYYEINSDTSRKVNVEYEIIDSEKRIVFNTKFDMEIVTGKNSIFYSIDSLNIGLGDYIITATIRDEFNNKYSVSKLFFSRYAGFPQFIKDLDKAIDQMMFITTSSELKFLREDVNKNEKLQRFIEFWKKKDPNPTTEENEIFNEYFRRVEYANKNFSHYNEGWRTDMGMVYILLGPPNNVDRHPFDIDSKPYEIWQYYTINRRFIFMDTTGFGNYKLITPLYGDDFRFR